MADNPIATAISSFWAGAILCIFPAWITMMVPSLRPWMSVSCVVLGILQFLYYYRLKDDLDSGVMTSAFSFFMAIALLLVSEKFLALFALVLYLGGGVVTFVFYVAMSALSTRSSGRFSLMGWIVVFFSFLALVVIVVINLLAVFR